MPSFSLSYSSKPFQQHLQYLFFKWFCAVDMCSLIRKGVFCAEASMEEQRPLLFLRGGPSSVSWSDGSSVCVQALLPEQLSSASHSVKTLHKCLSSGHVYVCFGVWGCSRWSLSSTLSNSPIISGCFLLEIESFSFHTLLIHWKLGFLFRCEQKLA